MSFPSTNYDTGYYQEKIIRLEKCMLAGLPSPRRLSAEVNNTRLSAEGILRPH
jgi:hypothetical protein